VCPRVLKGMGWVCGVFFLVKVGWICLRHHYPHPCLTPIHTISTTTLPVFPRWNTQHRHQHRAAGQAALGGAGCE
jgi:hypothetical protein